MKEPTSSLRKTTDTLVDLAIKDAERSQAMERAKVRNEHAKVKAYYKKIIGAAEIGGKKTEDQARKTLERLTTGLEKKLTK